MFYIGVLTPIHVLNMGLMENTPTGRLILHIMLAFPDGRNQQECSGGKNKIKNHKM